MGTSAVFRIGIVTALFGLTSLWGCASQPTAVSENEPRAVTFSASEREAITRYYASVRGVSAAVPATKYKVGDKLISGSGPRRLPTDLDVRLPRLEERYTRLVVGADVLLVDRETHDVLDAVPSVAY